MFRLSSKSAIWLLGQRLSVLTTIYEIRQITLHWRCASVHFSIQPTRPPARDGQLGTWVVGRSVVSNFPRYSGAQIHSLGRRAFQAVAIATCVISVSIPHSVVWVGY